MPAEFDDKKLIAQFMGIKLIPCGTKPMGQIKRGEESEAFINYDTDWNDLMPVVQKISDEYETVKIYFGNVNTVVIINGDNHKTKIHDPSPIKAIYLAVIDFIKNQINHEL